MPQQSAEVPEKRGWLDTPLKEQGGRLDAPTGGADRPGEIPDASPSGTQPSDPRPPSAPESPGGSGNAEDGGVEPPDPFDPDFEPDDELDTEEAERTVSTIQGQAYAAGSPAWEQLNEAIMTAHLHLQDAMDALQPAVAAATGPADSEVDEACAPAGDVIAVYLAVAAPELPPVHLTSAFLPLLLLCGGGSAGGGSI